MQAAPTTAPQPQVEVPPEPARGPRVVAVVNQKGGVGKSTTAVNLGACASRRRAGRSSSSTWIPRATRPPAWGSTRASARSGTYQVMSQGVPAQEAILETVVRGGVGASRPRSTWPAPRSSLSARSPARPSWPGPSIRSAHSSTSSSWIARRRWGCSRSTPWPPREELIVPIQCEYYALEGLGQLLRNVRLVQQSLNPRLRLTGIVLTMYDSRTKLAEQVVAEVRRYFGARVYDTIIPRTVRLSEAPGFGMPITAYDSGSKGAEAYRDLAKEFLEREADRRPAAGARAALGDHDRNPSEEGAPSGTPGGGAAPPAWGPPDIDPTCGRERRGTGHDARAMDQRQRAKEGDAVTTQRGGLGRGLSALIPGASGREQPGRGTGARGEPEPASARQGFDDEGIDGAGPLDPRGRGAAADRRPPGRRRLRAGGGGAAAASRPAGRPGHASPRSSGTTDDSESLREALIENIHREDLARARAGGGVRGAPAGARGDPGAARRAARVLQAAHRQHHAACCSCHCRCRSCSRRARSPRRTPGRCWPRRRGRPSEALALRIAAEGLNVRQTEELVKSYALHPAARTKKPAPPRTPRPSSSRRPSATRWRRGCRSRRPGARARS